MPSKAPSHSVILLLFSLPRDNSSSVLDFQDCCWDYSPDGRTGPEDPWDGSPAFRRTRSPPPPLLFSDQPDLSSLIDTNFLEQTKSGTPGPRLRTISVRPDGYDFGSLVGRVCEEGPPNCTTFSRISAVTKQGGSQSKGVWPQIGEDPECIPRRSSLGGDEPSGVPGKTTPPISWQGDLDSSVWSLELQGHLILAGRSNGRLEVRGVLAL